MIADCQMVQRANKRIGLPLIQVAWGLSTCLLPSFSLFAQISYPDEIVFPDQENVQKEVKSAKQYGIEQAPNVLFFLLDDAGWGDFSCNGQKAFQTPHIDSLAQQGIRFLNHYASAPVCAPSRCSLLTGKNGGKATIRGNRELGSGVGLFPQSVTKEGQEGLKKGEWSLGKLFQEAGYQTALVGKWGLGMPEHESSPRNAGFDHYFGPLCQRMAHSYFPTHCWEDDQKVLFPKNGGTHGTIWLHDEFEKKSQAYIDSFLQQERPFFLFATYTIPHGALQIPSGKLYDSHYHPFTQEKWWKKATPDMKRYAIMLHRVDLTIGKIVAQLERAGVLENTLILISSDNGPADEYGANPNYFESAGRFGGERLRGIKRALYEGGIKVPLIVSWKGKIPPHQESDHLFASYDLLPTFAQLLDVDLTGKGTFDGISFLPTLMGDVAHQKQHHHLYWEFVGNSPVEGGGPKQAVRVGDWKAILNFGTVATAYAGEGNIELYHLKEDSGEQKDLAPFYPHLLSQMRQLMIDSHVDSDRFPQIQKEQKVKSK